MAGLLGSQESFLQGGGTNAGWLDLLYHYLLNRGRDASSQLFLDCLNAGVCNREQVAHVLLTSAEYHRILVQQFYVTYLGRAADAGAADWVNALNLNLRREQILASFLASTEYFRAAGQGR